jgi:hypothetical protein
MGACRCYDVGLSHLPTASGSAPCAAASFDGHALDLSSASAGSVHGCLEEERSWLLEHSTLQTLGRLRKSGPFAELGLRNYTPEVGRRFQTLSHIVCRDAHVSFR